jgi:hypothetical protein
VSSRVFTAQYHGRCGICDEAIEEGDEACYEDDQVVHAHCASDPRYGDADD